MKTVLITRGVGYVGTELVKKLLTTGYGVQVIDTFWLGDHLGEHPNLIKIKLDIREFGVYKNFKASDSVIHLASIGNNSSGKLNPELSLENTIGSSLGK